MGASSMVHILDQYFKFMCQISHIMSNKCIAQECHEIICLRWFRWMCRPGDKFRNSLR